MRPVDLPKPYELGHRHTITPILPDTSWVRLAHFEDAVKTEGGLRGRPFRSVGGTVFTDNASEHDLPPYARYKISPLYIVSEMAMELEIEETIVFSIRQEDKLEYYNLLWLHPRLVAELGLTAQLLPAGLAATDKQGNAVLKMRTWSNEYIGDSLRIALDNEIPDLWGTDLIIRRDYFNLLCEILKSPLSIELLK